MFHIRPGVLFDPVLLEAVVLLGQYLYLEDHLVVELYHALVQPAEVPAHLLPLLGELLRHADHVPAGHTSVSAPSRKYSLEVCLHLGALGKQLLLLPLPLQEVLGDAQAGLEHHQELRRAVLPSQCGAV